MVDLVIIGGFVILCVISLFAYHKLSNNAIKSDIEHKVNHNC